ncbi:hypothetical protein [Flavobacterium sp.]|jgi:hypothetical protein|uniref:hypothetical protein n=1 Tax=Flavobacterium sp. TaxID=239 RepID=UPI001B579128|nr:hypothetical protein [Flavobacterium sp.]MBP6183282.1 hypothetical protein [Flavobacterium sp.]
MNKETLLTDWNFMRILRLALGIYIAVQAVETQSIFSGVVALFFIFQAVTNTGCCSSNGCSVPIKKNNSDKIEEVEYEEIK